MHAVLYLTRSDISGVCRNHPPAVVAWGRNRGSTAAAWPRGARRSHRSGAPRRPDLITTQRQAAALAATLGSGSLTDPPGPMDASPSGPARWRAPTRLYYLEGAPVALQRPPSEGRRSTGRTGSVTPNRNSPERWQVETTFAVTSRQFKPPRPHET